MLDNLDSWESHSDGHDQAFLQVSFARLERWLEWFISTQNGPNVSGAVTYRWRGREVHPNNSPENKVHWNPKTLTSGLDDYPRAAKQSETEYHVDLRCWIAVASGVLTRMAQLMGNGEKKAFYSKLHADLVNNKKLDELHWSSTVGGYCDFGTHCSEKDRAHFSPKLVDDVFGYVSIFPLLLRIIDPHSDKLGILLKNIANPQLCWTPFGLRSLGKSTTFYKKWNTPHDPPYWRGTIWININFCVFLPFSLHICASHPFRTSPNC